MLNENRIFNTKFEKLLGVIFDNRFNFNHDISHISETAGNKFNALDRVSNYMEQDKKRILFSSYFLSQFKYCPQIWMNDNKLINNRINSLHERAVRLIYCDHSRNSVELLQRDH